MAVVEISCTHRSSQKCSISCRCVALCMIVERHFSWCISYKAYAQGVKERMVDTTLNGSGVRDTSRVLSVTVGTVFTTTGWGKWY